MAKVTKKEVKEAKKAKGSAKKAEKSAPKNKEAKAKTTKGTGKRTPPQKDFSTSNKALIYTSWKKSKGKKTMEELHKEVKGAVKLTTIKGWTRRWAKGKGLPAIANGKK